MTAVTSGEAQLGLPAGARGVLPSQLLERAVAGGVVDAGDYKILPANIQPASVDLRLGEVAYRIRCSFLPDASPVDVKLKEFVIDEIDIRRDGAVLETNRPYLIPLMEELDAAPGVRGKANPKSSTGRLDVFTRVMTDHSFRFDEIAAGYRGQLYLEVVPLSFTVQVRQGLALNQLRLAVGATRARPTTEIRELHGRAPLLCTTGGPSRPSARDRRRPVPRARPAGRRRRAGRLPRRGQLARPRHVTGGCGTKPAAYWEPVYQRGRRPPGASPRSASTSCCRTRACGSPRLRRGDDRLRPDQRRAAHALRGVLRPGVRLRPPCRLARIAVAAGRRRRARRRDRLIGCQPSPSVAARRMAAPVLPPTTSGMVPARSGEPFGNSRMRS